LEPNVYVALWQTGFGAQLVAVFDASGLHPPRQNLLPEPQKPNSEQHGAEVGHNEVELQVCANALGAATSSASRATSERESLRDIEYM
jgi:hypothetical protein